jgi:hypothetical protein
MLRTIGVLGTALFLLTVGNGGDSRFSKYRAIETYEVRPGIMIMPRYADDGLVCEIGIEERHFSPEGISRNSGLSDTEIDQIANELVPSNERGPRPANLLEQGTTNISGNTMATSEEFENISIHIYRSTFPSSEGKKSVIGDAVATIVWKDRKCAKVAKWLAIEP